MSHNRRGFAGAWSARVLVLLPLLLLLVAAACSGDVTTPTPGPGSSGNGSNSGGLPGSSGSGTGVTPTAGTPGAGGAATAGTSSSGGAGNSNASAGTAGKAGSGSGGATGGGASSGGATSGGSAGNGTSGSATSGGSSAVGSMGCGKMSTITFGDVPNESGTAVGTGKGGYVKIQSSGRGFAMRLPDNYDPNKPYWLIFGFHWRGGNAAQVDNGGSNGYNMAHYGLQKLSKNGAIFVAPDGLGGGWGNSGGEDLKFVDDMLKLIQDNYCVDTKHIFANGFSWGGGMSYAIACARANIFRAVAIYDGAVLSGCDGGKDPIAYWQMAGLTDTTCPIDGAIPMRDQFVKNNGCTAMNPPQPPQPPPYLKTGGHICTDYTGCSSGHPLRWCVHQSGHGNAIVDGTDSLYNECATPPKTCSDSCPCTWVPDDVWKFFTQF